MYRWLLKTWEKPSRRRECRSFVSVAMTTIVRNQFVEVPGRVAGVAWRFLTDRWSLVENPPVDG